MADGLFGTRQSISDLPTPSITPAPIAGSTYVRPQQVSTGGNLQALAQSLSGLNQALQGYAQVKAVSDADPNSRANKEFLDSIQGKSAEELQVIAKQGGLTRIQSDGLSTLLGSKANSDFRLETADWYANDFDKNSGDLSKELEQRRQQYASSLPNDAAKAAFFKGTEDWSQRFLGADVDRKIGVAQDKRNEAVVDEFRTIADDGIAKGLKPDEIASQIIRQSGLNRDFRGLDGKTQNATIYALAQEYAQQGKPELVKALLSNDRGGVGSLIKSSDYGVKSYSLIEAAQTQSDQDYDKHSLDTRVGIEAAVRDGTFDQKRAAALKKHGTGFSDAQLASWVDQSAHTKEAMAARNAKLQAKATLVRQASDAKNSALAGAASTMDHLMGAQHLKDVELPTATGETKTYTAQQQIDDVVAAKQAGWEKYHQQMLNSGASADQADEAILKDKLNWFDGNNVPNPEWQKAFTSLPIVASAKRLAEGGKPDAKLASTAEQFYAIHKLNPAYARSLVQGEDANAFLDAYSDARSFMGSKGASSPEDALMEASRVTNMTPAQKAAATPEYKDIHRMVKQSLNDGYFFDSFDSNLRDNPENVGTAVDLVRTYMRRGMDEKTALGKAKQDIQKFAVPVNGVAVMTTGMNLQKDFGPMAENYLDDFAKHHGSDYGVKDGSELTLMRVAPDSDDLMVMRKDDMLPIGSVFNSNTLKQYRQIKQDEVVVKAAQWEKEKADKGILRASLDWVGMGFKMGHTNMTRPEADKFLGDQQEKNKTFSRIMLEARKQGVRYDNLNKVWRKDTGFLGGGAEVIPHVEWGSDGTYSVTFPKTKK